MMRWLSATALVGCAFALASGEASPGLLRVEVDAHPSVRDITDFTRFASVLAPTAEELGVVAGDAGPGGFAELPPPGELTPIPLSETPIYVQKAVPVLLDRVTALSAAWGLAGEREGAGAVSLEALTGFDLSAARHNFPEPARRRVAVVEPHPETGAPVVVQRMRRVMEDRWVVVDQCAALNATLTVPRVLAAALAHAEQRGQLEQQGGAGAAARVWAEAEVCVDYDQQAAVTRLVLRAARHPHPQGHAHPAAGLADRYAAAAATAAAGDRSVKGAVAYAVAQGLAAPGPAAAAPAPAPAPVPAVGAVRVLNANLWNFNLWTERLPLLRAEVAAALPDVVLAQEVRARKRGGSRADGRFQISDLVDVVAAGLRDGLRGGTREGGDAADAPSASDSACAPLHWVYEPAMAFAQGNELHHEGLAIVSRLPLLAHGALPLSQDPADPEDFHRRLCLWALVQPRPAQPAASPASVEEEGGGEGRGEAGTGLAPPLPVLVATVHMSLSPRARARALAELAILAEELARVHGTPGPCHGASERQAAGGEAGEGEACLGMVLAGDFNDELHKRADNPLLRAGFRDAWLERSSSAAPAPAPSPSPSPLAERGDTFNAWHAPEHRKRIDYVFLRGDVALADLRIAGDRPAPLPRGLSNGPVGGVDSLHGLLYASDHLFIAADLRTGARVP